MQGGQAAAAPAKAGKAAATSHASSDVAAAEKENEVVIDTGKTRGKRKPLNPNAAYTGPRRTSTRKSKKRRTLVDSDEDDGEDDAADDDEESLEESGSVAPANSTAGDANSSWEPSNASAAQTSMAGSEYMMPLDGPYAADPFSVEAELFPSMLGTPGKQQFPPMSPFRFPQSPGSALRRSVRIKTQSPAARGLLLSPVKLAPSTPVRPSSVPAAAATPSAQLASPSAAFSPTSLFTMFSTPRATPRRTIPVPRLDDGNVPSAPPPAAASMMATPECRVPREPELPASLLAPPAGAAPTPFGAPTTPSVLAPSAERAPRSITGRMVHIGSAGSVRSELAAINSRINKEPARKVLFTPTKTSSPVASMTPRRTPRRTPGETFCSPRTRQVMEALETAPSNAGVAELYRLEAGKDEGRRATFMQAEEVIRALSSMPPVGGWDV